MVEVEKQVILHRAQMEFTNSSALYRGFVGGRGSGKSYCGAFDLLERAKPGRTYLIGSPTGPLMNDTTYPTFKALALSLGLFVSEKLTPYPNITVVAGDGKAQIRLRTAEDPERMRGPNLSGVWLDEASLMDHSAYLICIAALREAGEQGWLTATFTPKGTGHWSKKVFADGAPDTAIFHSATRDNPFLPALFHETIAHQYSPALARQELEGVFCDVEGAEFPGEWFNESLWVPDFPADLSTRVIYLDPSLGKEAAPTVQRTRSGGIGDVKRLGDYSAYVMLGRDPAGTLYVKADMARRPTTQIVRDGIALARTFQPLDGFGVEANAFQELLADELARVSKEQTMMLPIYTVTNTTNKEDRIRRLTPYLSRGNVRFVESPGTRLLVQQLREFPMGLHDDGPDGMVGALQLAIDIHNKRHAAGRRR